MSSGDDGGFQDPGNQGLGNLGGEGGQPPGNQFNQGGWNNWSPGGQGQGGNNWGGVTSNGQPPFQFGPFNNNSPNMQQSFQQNPMTIEMNRQSQLSALQQQYPGYNFQGGNPFGTPSNYRWNSANRNDPINYNNYYNNASASNSQNRAFYFPQYDQQRSYLTGQRDRWQNMNPQDLLQYGGQQGQLISQLQDAAAGRGPSVAQLQLQSGMDKNLQSMLAARQTTNQYQNPGMSERNFMNAQSMANQDTNMQSAQLRAAEMLQNRQLLGSQIAQGNQQGLAAEGMQNQMVQYYIGQGFSLDAAQAASRQALESLLANQYQSSNLAQMQINAAANAQQNAFGQQNQTAAIGAGGAVIGGLAGGLAAAYSDEKLKKKIKDAGGDIDKFLSNLKAHKYEYKDKKFGEGQHISVMAQELEKSPIGKSMVFEGPNGKMVNYGKGLGAMLAAQAHLHQKISDLEEKIDG